jgi:hypothetical protein
VGPLTTISWITLKFNVFCWDKYYFSESLGCKLIENSDGFKNILLFFQKIVKQSKEVRHLTCLETNFILILNFPQISAKYAPKYQKRTIFYEFKQFWWIFNIFCFLCLCLITYFILKFNPKFPLICFMIGVWNFSKVDSKDISQNVKIKFQKMNLSCFVILNVLLNNFIRRNCYL